MPQETLNRFMSEIEIQKKSAKGNMQHIITLSLTDCFIYVTYVYAFMHVCGYHLSIVASVI